MLRADRDLLAERHRRATDEIANRLAAMDAERVGLRDLAARFGVALDVPDLADSPARPSAPASGSTGAERPVPAPPGRRRR
jgi:hypothetical protein